MDPSIHTLYTDKIINDACNRFGISAHQLSLLDGFENFVYAYERQDRPYILRVSHSLHRSYNATCGEIEWINYLSDHGVAAARAVPSLNGELVEMIPVSDGSHFNVVSLEKAPGHPPTQKDRSDALVIQTGRLVGQMNRLARDFNPSSETCRRPHWFKYLDGYAEKWLPEGNQKIIGLFNQLVADLRQQPTGLDTYGLVHQDVHDGNYFVDDHGRITLFDFDDCVYSWFAFDIAMVVFYATPIEDRRTPAANEKMKRFWGLFMDGYVRENTLAKQALQDIPRFLKLREMDLYIAIHRSFTPQEMEIDPFVRRYMHGRRQLIEDQAPYLEMAFDI
jgi:amicoumacin kinase